jgi:hypothetical protein
MFPFIGVKTTGPAEKIDRARTFVLTAFFFAASFRSSY